MSEAAVDHWYTEPWTMWRMAEAMARMLIVGFSCMLIAVVALLVANETGLVSREFVGMLGWLAFFMATLNQALPET